MKTKLTSEGCLQIKKDKKLPQQWKTTTDMIPRRLQELYNQGEMWEFKESPEIITGVIYDTI